MDRDEPLEPLSNLLKAPVSEAMLMARYNELALCVKRASGQQSLTSLPLSVDALDQYSERYLEVIQDRLSSLGYLPSTLNDIHAGKPGVRLQAGILAFQQDAGLLGDGWVGRKTWQALQQLVSFEEELEISRWLTSEGRPAKVLRRAMQLRLFALGCASQKPAQQLGREDAALKRFFSAAIELKLLSEHDDYDGIECLRLLLDQNRLVTELGQVELTERQRLSEDTQYLVIAAARIELWLLGYPGVRPDGARHEIHWRQIRRDRRGSHNISSTITLIRSNNKIARRSHFHQALCDFYEVFPLVVDKRQAKTLADDYLRNFPRFFNSLDESSNVEERLVEAAVMNFVAEDADNIRRLENEVVSLGSRLFDGIKRIGRFILRTIGLVLNKTAQMLKLLARPFHRMASRAFQGIKIAIEAMGDGLGLLAGKLFRVPLFDKAIGQFNADGDLTILVGDIESPLMDTFSEHLCHRSRAFRLACTLLNRFLNILANILEGVLRGALTGWWAFIQACLAIYHSSQSIVVTLDELRSLSPPPAAAHSY